MTTADHASAAAPSGRLGAIDALRCFAMTAVVAQHCGLLPFGWTGVWLFFVISGYVVTLTVVGRRSSLPPVHGLAHFFRRRGLRILPIYWLYVGVGLLVIAASGGMVDLVATASLLGFFNNLAMIGGRGELNGWPVAHLWTISVEMQFYLVYGFGLFFLRDRTTRILLVCALALAPMLRLAATTELARLGWSAEASAFAIYAGPFLHVDAFAAGALLAFASRSGALAARARPLAATGFGALAAYAAVFVWVNHALLDARGIDMLRNVLSGILYGQHREVIAYSALVAACAGLVALAATDDARIAWLLRPRLLRRIGEISYGAYVLHCVAITVAVAVLSSHFDAGGDDAPVATRILLFSIAYPLTLLAAEVSFRWFERRWLSQPRPQAGGLGGLSGQLATAAADGSRLD